MQWLSYLISLLIYTHDAPKPLWDFLLLPESEHHGPPAKISLPGSSPKSLLPRTTDSRRVYLVFQAVRLPPRNAISPVDAPTSIIHMNVQLEPGPFPGAWPYTTIQLVKTPFDHHDATTNDTITKQVFQVWLTQMGAPLATSISHLPDGQEFTLGSTHCMNFFVGTTSASDNAILEPRTGAGLLLQVVRSLPQITPSPGQTRGAFIRDVIRILDIRPSRELTATTVARMNFMTDLAQSNDMRSVYSDGRMLRDVFPDRRIPCIVNYKMNPPSSTGIAYNVLDDREPRRSGRLQMMEALPDRTIFGNYLQRFLSEPGWNGDLYGE